VRPDLSARLLDSIRDQHWQNAEACRESFRELEDLRNAHSPIRVLHAAVQASGIANIGPIMPLAGKLEGNLLASIESTVHQLQNSALTA
jgi:dihydrodipicolinate synthase/N-acetylneuraminate lyase